MKRGSINWSITAVIFVIIFCVACLAHADPTVSVSYNTQSFQVSSEGYVGSAQGNRNIDVIVSRRDPDTFCDRVGYIYVYVQVSPSDTRLVSKKVGSSGLCNFDETVQVECATMADIDQTCTDSGPNAGKIKLLDRSIRTRLVFNNGNMQDIAQANIQLYAKCLCNQVRFFDVEPRPIVYIGGSRLTTAAGWGVSAQYISSRTTLCRLFGYDPISKQVTGNLPPGMTLDIQDDWAKLNGQATTEGNYAFTVRIFDSCPLGALTAEQAFMVPVRCGKFEFPTGIQLPPATMGVPYSYQLQTSCNSAYTGQEFRGSTLPAGLTISPTGLISGTPATPGSYTIQIEARSTQGDFTYPAKISLPLKVKDTIPPQLLSFTATPMTMTYEGGQITVAVKAADNVAVQGVTAILIKPDGTQSGVRVPQVSGSQQSGEWRTSWIMPTNWNKTPLIYGIKVTVADVDGNLFYSQPLAITVSGKTDLVIPQMPPGTGLKPQVPQPSVPPFQPK